MASSPRTTRTTRVLPADVSKIGRVRFSGPSKSFLDDWTLELSQSSPDAAHLREAASQLQTSETPVAFPTETVYGLGADATRSSAVQGIYAAKQRPSDNPLIVHISSLSQLRRLLLPPSHGSPGADQADHDLIPSIYHSLISRFWPGPLTILLPLPSPSPLAPEVTASLPTFAVRMPSSLLALALIHLAGVPLAAPSANASTKPSPTTAAHVLNDLAGRIDLILDGGPCDIGVESTVVDGLSNPPIILRPGGVSIEKLRQCPGWERVMVGYKDGAEKGTPRAPGMKYKHYSPKARVILVEGGLDVALMEEHETAGCIGVLTTKTWQMSSFGQRSLSDGGNELTTANGTSFPPNDARSEGQSKAAANASLVASTASGSCAKLLHVKRGGISNNGHFDVWTISLGNDTTSIARGLFSALRELDEKSVDTILVESISDNEGEAAAAIMNRLRKAAEVRIKR